MMESAPASPGPATSARRGHAGSLPRTVHVDPRLTFRLGMVFMLIAGMLLAWLGSVYYRMEANNDLALMRAGNDRILRLATLAMTESLAGTMSDLRYLGRHNELDAYLRTGGITAARDLAREYAALLRQKRDYDQVRFIDADGRERIRVNQAPDGVRITPTDQLQAEGTRDYFKGLAHLDANEIYVSPMDLNVEHGRIERPLKPMIRFGMAVFDRQGKRRGYVVINYLAEHLLGKISAVAGANHPLWLLDAQGERLLGPNAEDDWSGQLPERRQHGFARLHPAAWETMRHRTSGTLSLDAKDLEFVRVYPLRGSMDTDDRVPLAQPVASENYYWYLLIANSPATVAASRTRLSSMTIRGGIALALLVIVLSSSMAYAIARQRALSKALEQAVDNLPVLIAYIDARQRFRFNNRAYLDTYGITPKNLYGRHVREILGEAGYGQVRPHLEQALAGRRMEFELHGNTGPGPRDLAVTYVPDVADSGQVQGVYALITDITLHQAAEQRERDHLLELARISRLASMGEITSEIAHQINQPLAAIAMFSNAAQRTLENGGDQGKLRDWMETINCQAKRAGDVVQRLRRVAQSGEIKSTPLDLNDRVREVVALAEPEARAKQVDLRLELADPLPVVLAASILMEQVIYNLVHNAIRAAADQVQPRQVTIRTHADASRVWVEVFDYGPRMRQEPGRAVGEPAADQFDAGLGIGLSISRSIVTSYHGDLICGQREEGGGVVSFSLPSLRP
jgi:PAS domain S-box-containing protein